MNREAKSKGQETHDRGSNPEEEDKKPHSNPTGVEKIERLRPDLNRTCKNTIMTD